MTAAPVSSSPARSPLPARIDLLGVPLDRITAAEALDYIVAEHKRGRGGWVLTPNLEIVRLLVRQADYARITSGATLRVADGMPLIWASYLQRTPLPERVAGSELIWSLTARAASEGMSVFFLGGNPGVAEAAASRLQQLHPTLRVAGFECPPFGFDRDEAYLARLTEKLRAAAPDVCFVALSSLKQDRLINRLRPHFPGTWFLGIGISFSFVVGEVRQAPRLLRRLGLEWSHRLAQEPRRLARRYLIDGLPFAVGLLASSAFRGLCRRPAVRKAPTAAESADYPA